MQQPITLEEIKEKCLVPGKSNFAVLAWRVGVNGWMTELEYTHFKPDTEANNDFWLSLMKWPDDSKMLWVIVTIPSSYEKIALALLWKHGLKTMVGHTHMAIDSKGPHVFPLQGENVFCLENHSQGGPNVIYTNDPTKLAEARQHERDNICAKFHREHEAWLRTPEGMKEAVAYWKKYNIGGEYPPNDSAQPED